MSNITPNGKEIEVRIRPNTNLWEIVFAGGGQRPKEFDGGYTSPTEAQKVIDAYLNKRAKTSAKSNSK